MEKAPKPAQKTIKADSTQGKHNTPAIQGADRNKDKNQPAKKQGANSRISDGGKPFQQVFSGLSSMRIRVDTIHKPPGSGFDDTAYVLVPALRKRLKSSLSIRLRVIVVDTPLSAAYDYRLTLDSVGYAAPMAKKLKGPSIFNAGVTARDKTLAIKLFKPGKEIPGDKTTASPVVMEKENENGFPRMAVFLLVLLAGFLVILWISNRFLVFSIHVRPTGSKKINAGKADHQDQEALDNAEMNPRNGDREQHYFNEMEEAEALPAAIDNSPMIGDNEPGFINNKTGRPANKYFLSEIMLTAGPRKNYTADSDPDKDLGEDICGFISDAGQLLIWLLDGTSDQYCLRNPVNNREYFSSRLLAQSLGNQMRAAFTQLPYTNIDKLIEQAICQVKADWIQAINNLPEEEKEVLKLNIENNNIPECATTLLVGQLAINGDLTAYRSGDSKMVLYNRAATGEMNYLDSSMAGKNPKSNDRLFFRLLLDAEGGIDILNNIPRFEMIKENNINALVAFSDGVGMETEMMLKEGQANDLEAIRSEIIYHHQGTVDDKSICFFEIKEETQLEEQRDLT